MSILRRVENEGDRQREACSRIGRLECVKPWSNTRPFSLDLHVSQDALAQTWRQRGPKASGNGGPPAKQRRIEGGAFIASIQSLDAVCLTVIDVCKDRPGIGVHGGLLKRTP